MPTNGARLTRQLSQTALTLDLIDDLSRLTELAAAHSPDLAILAISGGGSFVPGGYLKSALMLGADKALEKPFSLSLLLETVDELLDRPTPIAAATANGR